MHEGTEQIAPVWRRVLAAVLDLGIILTLTGGGLWLAWRISAYMNFPRSSLAGVGEALNAISPAALVFNFLAIPIYFAVFESSGWHATPGKRLLGLEVQALSFWRSLAARFFYWLPWVVLPFGFIYYPLYWLALFLMAAAVAGIFSDRRRRSAADFLLGRLVVSRSSAAKGDSRGSNQLQSDAADTAAWFARLPVPIVGGIVLSIWLLAPAVLTFSFGQAGNLIYKRKLAQWREKGIYRQGRLVFVERALLAPHIIEARDLAEFEADPDCLPPEAIVEAASACGRHVVGIVPEGSLLTLDDLEPADAAALETEELTKLVAAAKTVPQAPMPSPAPPSAGLVPAKRPLIGPVKQLVVYRWRETVRRGQLVSEGDIEPVVIDQEQYNDSMCFARWQILGRRISENCTALRRDIIHFQYLDMPFTTLVAKRALKGGQVPGPEDFEERQLLLGERYYSAVSAPYLVQGLSLKHDVAAGQYLRYCDFANLP